MGSFQTVLFDLDGTLLNTLEDLTDAVNHTLKAHGYPPRKKEEIRRFLGNGSKHLIRCSLPADVGDEALARIHGEYLTWYHGHAQIKTAPYEGIPELLNELKKSGIPMAVVSNKGDGQVKPLTAHFFPQIDLAIGEREGIRRKPYPDSIFEAMKTLDAQPSNTIFVGDSEVDLQTAKNAGIRSVAVGWGFRDKAELLKHTPDIFLDHPLDLLSKR